MKTHRFTRLVPALFALLASSSTYAHGLIEDPPSRNWLCGAVTKPDQIANGNAQYPVCGDAFAFSPTTSYNFMSVLTHDKGRAVVTPLPDNVCGFDAETWQGGATPWDQAIDWPTTKVSAGRRKITWNISWGSHFSDTEEFRYWITKPGFQFSKTRPLAWSDFEDTEFCVQKYNDATPSANPDVVADKAAVQFHTYCTIPARSGHHVVYGEWGRNQWTYERFHGCMDLSFEGAAPALEARISAQPNVTEFSGAGSILLDASTSVGKGLSYTWSVNAPNPALYHFDNASAVQARLSYEAPAATGNVLVSLQVRNADGTSNASKSFTHKSTTASAWTDLGALTPAARTLNAGDKISVRAVLADGKDQYVPTTPVTVTAATTAAEAWPLALAQAVNAQAGNLRIGVLSGKDVTPAANATSNRIYAAAGSTVANAFLQVEAATPDSPIAASFSVKDTWPDGYCANIKVTNNGSAPVVWTAKLKVSGKVSQVWNGGTWSFVGDTLSISGPDWAKTLAAGASYTDGGFCATNK